MQIIDYINDRNTAKNTDFSKYEISLPSLDTMSDPDESPFSYLKKYIDQIDVVNIENTLKNLLQTFSYYIAAGSQIQPIYGFKVFQSISIRKKQMEDNELNPYSTLGLIYSSSIQTSLSSDLLHKVTFDNVQISKLLPQFLSFDLPLKHNSSIIFAQDIVAILNNLMGILTNIRKLHCNIYTKIIRFAGSMNVYACTDCILRDVDKDSHSQWYVAVIIGPYCSQMFVNPTLPDNDSSMDSYKYSRSISAKSQNRTTIEIDNNNLNSLAYITDIASDLPTFDVASSTGSNGVFTVYREMHADTFDLKRHIDVESFGIKSGNIISGERLVAAISYIFELWQKNIKLLQCNYFVCHLNCHGNSINEELGEILQTNLVYGDIEYDYSALSSTGLAEDITYNENPNNNDTFAQKKGTSITSIKIYYPQLSGTSLNEKFYFSADVYGIKNDKFTHLSTYAQTRYQLNGYFTVRLESFIYSKLSVVFELAGGSKCYHVYFYVNGNRVNTNDYYMSLSAQESIYDPTSKIPNGYDYSGWIVNDLSVDTSISNSLSAVYIPAKCMCDLTANANLSEILYRITYENMPLGSSNDNPSSATYNERITLTDPELPEGYIFKKWTRDGSSSKLKTVTITTNLSIYCNYTAPAPLPSVSSNTAPLKIDHIF